ncbi:hypothetical protein SAMN05421505_13746 [Sinosporangium album]|uniref:Uncharacterized protein n=1 Tax=Sinosporangium album TaxID=504805 RepID=A0A1G8IIH0_9ACTN|nr:hypothetical protein SAMN05421505_13746 [Sinosporangium album]
MPLVLDATGLWMFLTAAGAGFPLNRRREAEPATP